MLIEILRSHSNNGELCTLLGCKITGAALTADASYWCARLRGVLPLFEPGAEEAIAEITIPQWVEELEVDQTTIDLKKYEVKVYAKGDRINEAPVE